MSILIISVLEDLHARAIAWGLNKAGLKTDIFDATTFPSNNQLFINPLDECENTLHLAACNHKNELINLKNIKVVWCRRLMTNAQYFDYSQVHSDDLNNVVPEVQAFIGNLWGIADDILNNSVSWVNRIDATTRAKSKALQLKIAHSVGLLVPDTIMGNNPAYIRAFCEKHGGKIIVKPFFPKTWKENETEYNQPAYFINSTHLTDDMSIQLCPGIYQNYIAKQFELRVVVLGRSIIAAKLNSQEHEHSKVDWRLDAYKGIMLIEPYHLDEAIKEKIFLFMKKMGLKFGSIDLIVTPKNEIFFLEINEQGQFLFLDKQCPALNVLGATCKFLASEAGFHADNEWPTLLDYFDSDDNIMLTEQRCRYMQKLDASSIKYSF